ncbi:MAG TPA: hypothetical protein VFR18_07725 [Terriglobia bacterium]|nr:hypothetical protein [Terriglobia bacterium]
MRSRTWIFVLGLATTTIGTSVIAFAQFDAVLDRVRQGADQVNASNPTYYLKAARAVEPNICLYSNGDPSGLIGPLVFQSSYVATPNCREMKACTDVATPVDEPKPSDCGAEIPNSRFWSRDDKRLNMRSDGNAFLEFTSEEFMKVRTCTSTPAPIDACTTGKVGLFRAEVEYEYPSSYNGRHGDRYQNLAGRPTETKTYTSWVRGEENVKTGGVKTTRMNFVGQSSGMVPAHDVSATVSHKYGDQVATIRFREDDADLKHYTRLRNSSDGSQEWEITAEINRRPSPAVTRVGFLPATFSVSVEDNALPDLLALPGAQAMRTKYLITVFTEKSHKDETLIFQTEAENTAKTVLFTLKMDEDTLRAMKGKDKKLRVHVRAQRMNSPWVDGAVSAERVYETEKSVKFPKK